MTSDMQAPNVITPPDWDAVQAILRQVEEYAANADDHDPEAATDPETSTTYCRGCTVAAEAGNLRMEIADYLEHGGGS